MGGLNIRSMNRDEVDWAIELAAAEGWNPGLSDAEAFYTQDPEGFIVGVLDGKPIGCISAIAYEGGFGFIGFYIVEPPYRGQGYGIQLWQHAIRRLQGRTIGLDGVIDQVDNYSKSGFTLVHSNIRFELNVHPESFTREPGIIPADQIAFEQIKQYDQQLFLFPRPLFLNKWLNPPLGTALVAVENGRLCGYGVIRPCRSGFKIGPLFADHAKIADTLFRSLCASISSEAPVYLDVPEVNQEGIRLAHRYGMEKVFGTARMYKEHLPPAPMSRTFGVTTFELG